METALTIILFASFPLFSVLLESKLHGLQHQACSLDASWGWPMGGTRWSLEKANIGICFLCSCLLSRQGLSSYQSQLLLVWVFLPHRFQSSRGSENTLPSPFPFDMGYDVSSSLMSSSSPSPLLC